MSAGHDGRHAAGRPDLVAYRLITARKGSEQVATAEEKINEALAELGKIDVIKKLAGVMRNATRIEGQCNGLNAGVRRLLDQALGALSGITTEVTEDSQNDDAA